MNGMAPGEPLGLTLQFGGSSGYGFMSIEQRRRAREEFPAEDRAPAGQPA
ncbi:hypothetical protein ACFC09_02865 [Streptomyces sp. NPDC056161]